MGRRKNTESGTFNIVQIGPNKWRLQGYLNGEQIRKQGTDLVALETLQNRYQNQAINGKIAALNLRPMPDSWITITQLHEAESAFQMLVNSAHSLTDCVKVALAQMGNGVPADLAETLADYVTQMEARRCSVKHVTTTKWRLDQFFAWSKAKTVPEIDGMVIDRYCLRPKVAAASRISDATAISAFFQFAVRQRLIRQTPFQVNMPELRKQADREREPVRVLTIQQAQNLLDAAIASDLGSHVPLVLLGVWGGIRPEEISKLKGSDIVFEGSKATVYITPAVAKTAKYRSVELPENIVPLLKACVDRGIMPKDEAYGPESSATWLDIREAAGMLKLTRCKKYNKRIIVEESNLWQQDIMRHTGVSFYYKKTGNIVETARWAGHSKEIGFKHYIQLARQDETAAFYAITGSLTNPEAPALVA